MARALATRFPRALRTLVDFHFRDDLLTLLNDRDILPIDRTKMAENEGNDASFEEEDHRVGFFLTFCLLVWVYFS